MGSSRTRRTVAALLGALLAVGGCTFFDRDRPTSTTADVGSDGFVLELSGVTISGPPGVAELGTTVRAEVLADAPFSTPEGVASAAGVAVAVTLGEDQQPAQPITLEFTGSEMEETLAVLTETDDGRADLFAVVDDGGTPTAVVDHLSRFSLVKIDVAGFWADLARAIDTVLGLHTPAPDCSPEARHGAVSWTAVANPAELIWPCLRTDDEGMHLSLTAATGVPYSIRTDPAGSAVSVPGPSMGSMASVAFFDRLPQAAPTALASPGGGVTVTTPTSEPFTVAQARAHPASLLVESLVYGLDLALTVWGISELPWEDAGNLQCAGRLVSAAEAVGDQPQPATVATLVRSVVDCAQQLVSDQAGRASFSWLAERGAAVLLGIVGTGAGLLWSHVRGAVGELTGDGLVTISITGETAPLDEAALLTAPVPSLCKHPAGTLVDGILPGIAEREGHVGIERPDGRIPEDRVVYRDLDHDGENEAAVVLSCSRGGVPWPEAIVVYGPGPTYLGHLDLGDFERDRPRVASLEVIDDRVEARVTGFVGPGDGACCGRVDAVVEIALVDGAVELAAMSYFDERNTVEAIIRALGDSDRAAVQKLSAEESIADFLSDSYGGTSLELRECRVQTGHAWGDVACEMHVLGSEEPPAQIYLSRVGFAQWQMEAFLSPRFMNE